MDIRPLEESARGVRRRLREAAPDSVLILGSGWGVVVEAFELRDSIAYSEIPVLGETGVPGHKGRLLLARHGGRELLIFQGRRHWYEGAGWEPIAFPIYLAAALGARHAFLTNAAGGIRPDLKPGTLMVIDDHINAIGASPLVGPHAECWGPRFPDMSVVYDATLRAALDAAGASLGQPLAHGVYLAASGPVYETPAEIRAFRALGADAVGMSTVPEATLAHAAGLRVAGLSCISNCAAGVADAPLSHDEVLAETQRAQQRMRALLARFFEAPAGT